ncbi:aldehyde dehydrogenase family protein [Fibrisoma montanum]|uniref:Aldehyde dehydrogenase n=1 Tax=Fibrisoma montanum TaxID=2305895 RepID=A0A418M2D1_9BACT|nr:aldehyde dehydrogenase family protein [Fibrisoma montanum]RIV19883.1 aldehyde dehydrogenase family protein [Fibrisoma montanum]
MITLPTETELRHTLRALFDTQRRHAPQQALTTADQRIERIRRVQRWITDHEADIQKAMYDDFRKPAVEVSLAELYAVLSEIKYTAKHLKQWMKPQRVPTPVSLIGTKSHIRHEPKGNVLILAPWNYPFSLIVRPLVSAIAAGNVAMLKPSEMTPHTAALLHRMIDELFPPEEVALVEGDAGVAQALLDLPFNHIFFTGSPAVGRIVMAAAANHLASVTLELGGKSPAIVDETADLSQAAGQLAWGKYINNGQTCIAPDYLLVHQSVKEPFMNAFRQTVETMYRPNGQPADASDSYARIVNRRHFQRIRDLLDEAVQKGATVTIGGRMNEADNFIEPTVVEGVSDDMRIMQEEIFGPVLPVLTYTNLDDALRVVNTREKPLALYIHSRSRRNIQYVLDRTSAGDTVVNETMLQFGNVELPFGGVNNSGLGKSNGFFSFQEFSNQRGVMVREFGTMKFLYPPYTDKVRKLIGWLTKYV